jgi:hypothetical protein
VVGDVDVGVGIDVAVVGLEVLLVVQVVVVGGVCLGRSWPPSTSTERG